MPNPEHVSKLREGVAAWNQWRIDNPELIPDLTLANLTGADLEGAYLHGADLTNADLRGASYGEDVPLTRCPVQISGLRWHVLIMDTHVKIACELHSTVDWLAFDDERIARMDCEAIGFLKEHKEYIMGMAKAHQGE
ncbi:MAG: pentapeptide repeat-containing protein [Chloroflexi bacterium]|nr:pentapeptide repeat-containing protein [Chloroflexota bacterium]